MAIVKCKPTSAGRRFVVKVVNQDLHKGAPYAPLVEKQSKSGGRNNNGRITTRHVGGGHKQHYRLVDFRRNKDGIPAIVERVEYDPNRTAHIALLKYADGERRYVIAPKGISAGDQLISGAHAPIKPGNTLPLRNIPVGSTITASSSSRARALSSLVRQVHRFSWSLAKVLTSPSACAPVKCARFWPSAARPWAKSRTTSTAAFAG